MSRPAANLTLAFILTAYLILGTAYAFQTPAWQAPDEPAHYNYIQFIVEKRALPTLQQGEYDQAYIAEFTRTPQNTASMSTDPLRYEDYAPPLYYLLAAPIYALADGWITAIRLLSVVLGGMLVVVAYLVSAELYPDQLAFALGGAAFVAFVPQHLAIMSAINNDSLAELLIALTVWQCLRLLRAIVVRKRRLILLGVTLGLGLLTKATFYYTAVPIAVVTLAWLAFKQRPVKNGSNDAYGWRVFIKQLLIVFGPALLFGAVWWLRNISVYGGLDVMGLAQHNAVVAGQPTTAQWLIDYGAGGLLQRFLTTTYQSFWGQFGWMSTPMPNREYVILGMVSVIALVGWIGWVVQRLKRPSHRAIILVVWFGLTVVGYLYYNVTFVQHQGRYLFPALIPIGLVFAIGWWQILNQIKQLSARLLSRSTRNLMPWLDRAQLIIFALVFIYLARLDLVALQRYIIPNLAP